MDPKLRIVTSLPLSELWDVTNGVYKKHREIGTHELRELLKIESVQFVIADSGHKLEWIDTSNCFIFWKDAVQRHLAQPDQHCTLEDFPDNFFYFASEWRHVPSNTCVVLLEKYH